ncbi:MAG: helix-turn-helix domain-containing protein [Chloroflexota bacterium]|nr:helix-turn-helix domain-containing protein [Chloroflexota bacterium]
MDVGRRVRELREARGLTQRELARRASLTPMGVSRIERAGNKSSALSIDRLAQALNVNPGELFKDPTRPKVVTLPSTPVTDTPAEDLDEWLRSTESAAQVDEKLRAVEAEARDLEDFISRHVLLKLDRARLYRFAILDRWLKLADKERKPESNRFKTVAEIAEEELGGRYAHPRTSDRVPRAHEEEAC